MRTILLSILVMAFPFLAPTISPNCCATLVTFDDLSETGSGSDFVFKYQGYEGLTWNDILCNNAILFTNVLAHLLYGISTNGLSGDYYGMVSSSNVISLGTGSEIDSSGTNFDFVSAYMTGYWRSNLNIEVQGFRGGTLIYDSTVVASAANPTLFTFDFDDIDRVTFESSGGDDAGFGNPGNPGFIMDNMTFDFVPEPSSLLLAVFGALFLWPLLRRKRLDHP